MPDIQITMTQTEALVLFELLSRYADKGLLGTQDQSEQRALWNLHCKLENVLPEALHRDYQDLLDAAQDELRDAEGTNAHSERQQGRIAFWLDPGDIEYLVNEWRKMPQTAPEGDRQRWANIAFRAMAALRKGGIEYGADVPDVGYVLVPREPGAERDVRIEPLS